MLRVDSTTIVTYRGMTVRLDPAHWSYVYLIHFSRPIGNPEKARGRASHYLGSTGNLNARLQLHRTGQGAALMAAVSKAGIDWHVSRLWRFETCEQARAFERKLKRTGHNPRVCPLCNPGHVAPDALARLRAGHWPLSIHAAPGRRRPMNATRPVFVRRAESEA